MVSSQRVAKRHEPFPIPYSMGATTQLGLLPGSGAICRRFLVTVVLMWEARAAAGRGEELLAWAQAQEFAGKPLRREIFRAPRDRVLVITWWDAPYDAGLPELPEPDGELMTRTVHRWRFESVGLELPQGE